MAYKTLPSSTFLRKFISCNPEQGTMIWLPRSREEFKSQSAFVRWNKLHAGTPAFASPSASGYLTGMLFGSNYYAHRIVWMWVHDEQPIGELDHINGDKTDNRIKNLRAVSRVTNCQNKPLRSDNKSGIHGVDWHPQCKKWKVTITANKRRVYIGVFADFEDAVAARKAAEVKHGFHVNHGR